MPGGWQGRVMVWSQDMGSDLSSVTFWHGVLEQVFFLSLSLPHSVKWAQSCTLQTL